MIPLKNYLQHHLGLVFIIILGTLAYVLYPSFLARNFIVLTILVLSFILNIFYHLKHSSVTVHIVLEYFLISLFIYLVFLFVHLF